MRDDAERLEIVDKVMEQKEIIKKASQTIVEKMDDPLVDRYIDTKVIEILNAVSNIGIIINEPERFSEFIHAWKGMVEFTLALESRQLRMPMIRRALNTICAISFVVKKKRGKYEINIPKIDFNVLKIGA